MKVNLQTTGVVLKFLHVVHKNVLFEQKSTKLQNKWLIVEYTTKNMHDVLRVQ
jgi:hypothetical protein